MIAETLLFRLAIYPGIIGHEKGDSGAAFRVTSIHDVRFIDESTGSHNAINDQRIPLVIKRLRT